jgi:hypothetical protein
LAHNQKDEFLFLQARFLEEDSFTILPEVDALEVIGSRSGCNVLTVLSVDFDVVEGFSRHSGSQVDSHLLEVFLVLKFNVVDLGCILAEHEDYIFSREQMLSITPLCI